MSSHFHMFSHTFTRQAMPGDSRQLFPTPIAMRRSRMRAYVPRVFTRCRRAVHLPCRLLLQESIRIRRTIFSRTCSLLWPLATARRAFTQSSISRRFSAAKTRTANGVITCNDTFMDIYPKGTIYHEGNLVRLTRAFVCPAAFPAATGDCLHVRQTRVTHSRLDSRFSIIFPITFKNTHTRTQILAAE
jgi:hypothetical protein